MNDLKVSLVANNTIHKPHLLLNKNCFVEPVEVALAQGESFMYISILQNLGMLLKHSDIFSYVMESSPNRPNNLISNFSDGSKCENCEFLSKSSCLHIQFYIDDFQIANPLSSSARNNKICAIYWTLGNIPQFYRSKLYNIQVAVLAKHRSVKKHGLAEILKPLLKDLMTLENGYDMEGPNGQILNFNGTVSMVISDNLAAHEIGGFIESFSSLRVCRFCSATKQSIKDSFMEKDFEKRTIETFNASLEIVENNEAMSTTYGIKTDSPLNQLQYFHVCWGLPSDLAHDIFEGFGLDLLKSIINYSITNKFFSLNELNAIIKSYPYASKDKRNKPAEIFKDGSGQLAIRQSASQSLNLLCLLPLFVANKIPEDDSHWKNYIEFLDILDMILSSSLVLGEIRYMELSISNFLQNFFRFNPAISVKPKAHYLIHYASQYRLFGPLINQSTLRYEGKHAHLKSFMKKSKNFRNPCKSISYQNQYTQCLYHMNEDFLQTNSKKYSKVFYSKLFQLPFHLQQRLSTIIDGNPTLCLARSLVLHGLIYEKGSSIVINNNPLEFA